MPTPALPPTPTPSLPASPAGRAALRSTAGDAPERGRAEFRRRCSRKRSTALRRPAANPIRRSEAVAAGKANVIDVVTAVAEAETAVSALVAVRDNVIQSYQEVMRMTI